jgi:tetratricopeptide (TPR) repeat protein
MGGGSGRHAELAGELVEWWEDLWQRGMTSRVVLAAVPPGWGRTTVLDRLAEAAGADDVPVTLIARINGRELPDRAGAQAAVLRDCLAEAEMRRPVVDLLGLDRLGGITQMGLGVGSLFVSALAAQVGFLVAGVAVATAGKVWDDSPAGQDGALARAARAVAETSVRVPTVVIVDDADWVDEALAVTLIENLAARHNGHVLAVAAVDPGGSLQRALLSRARQGITEGLVHVAEAEPGMGYESRTVLVRELCPHLPDAAVRRIGRATATFAEVFAVTSAPRLTEITADQDPDEARLLAVTDEITSARLQRPDPSQEAVVIAWADGLLHARQAARALGVLGLPRAADGDPDVLRTGGLERVTDPASPRLAGQVTALAVRDRQAMAAVLLDEAVRITVDPGCGLVERMAAAQAAHQVRADLADRSALPGVQRELAAALEALGEPAAALDVAAAALEDWPPGASAGDRDWLAAAVLRLAALTPPPAQPPLVAQLIAEATAGGAGLGLEARIWAAIELLRTSSQRAEALDLADQAAAALDEHAAALGPAADQWRLLLAFHSGRAGHPALAGRLLAQLLNSGDDRREDAARAVLYACAGPGADTRLQNIVLEAELAVLPPDAGDDRLRIHHTLAANHNSLGEYRQALAHGQHELTLRTSIQSPDHPDTLTTRHNIAYWTGRSGDLAGALRLFRELLPDQRRVLGPDHPYTLAARHNIAYWTGEYGDAAGALRLFRELLPDRERVLGPDHPYTLAARHNIARWTGECGDAAAALRLSWEVLPDQRWVLGPDHLDTLNTRNNIAYWTGECGDAAGAVRLFRELLADRERVLGPDHPGTLITRGSIAYWTGECGDAAGALRLNRELLPDQRVLGPDHPYTLNTRNNIAYWTGECGDAAGALRLFRELLADRERVLGPDHPDTLTTRHDIAIWTGRCGDAAAALRLSWEVLPDRERVLGPDHPDTLTTRNNIAYWARMLTEKGGSDPYFVTVTSPCPGMSGYP